MAKKSEIVRLYHEEFLSEKSLFLNIVCTTLVTIVACLSIPSQEPGYKVMCSSAQMW